MGVVGAIYRRAGRLRPVLDRILPSPQPRFSGWGMATWQMLPWETPWGRTLLDLPLDSLEHTDTGRDDSFPADLNALMYRHWHVAYAMQHALAHISTTEPQAVEVGVAEGITAYIALAQGPVTMHLYDPWDATRPQDVSGGPDESGFYDHLDIDRTRRNLAPFTGRAVFHRGYLPDSLDETAPHRVVYLHIDINAAIPTRAALEFFWPRLVPGGTMLLNYYGWPDWHALRGTVDEFLDGRPGTMMPLPTGQALYFR